jgi:hypothetical protein
MDQKKKPFEVPTLIAYSAQSGHSFRSIPATDSADCGRGRSEATLEFFS